MPNYRISWPRLVLDLIPAVLRKDKMLAFLEALVSPVRTVHQRFLSFRSVLAAEIPIGPEVRVLRHYLNQYFDSQGRIQVIDGQEGAALRIYTRQENQPIYLPVFLASQRIDFTVEVPQELQGFDAAIRAFLDRHKLPTKSYRINYV